MNIQEHMAMGMDCDIQEIEDLEKTDIDFYNEILKYVRPKIVYPVRYRRVSNNYNHRLNVHMNGQPAADPRPYGTRPY